MKKNGHPSLAGLLICALVTLLTSCGVMDVRNASEYNSVVGAMGAPDPPVPPASSPPPPPTALLTAVNVVRAPFVVVVGGLETVGMLF